MPSAASPPTRTASPSCQPSPARSGSKSETETVRPQILFKRNNLNYNYNYNCNYISIIYSFELTNDGSKKISIVKEQEKDGEEFVAEVCIPEGAQPGQNFVAIIDGTEFEVPVPVPGKKEGFGDVY